MGRLFFVFGVTVASSRPSFHQPTEIPEMKQHLVSYAWFLGFLIVTKAVVAPLAKSMSIPYGQDL
jgi:hypothetical protein